MMSCRQHVWKGDDFPVDIETLKSKVAYFMKRLYERGLTTSSGGNVSARHGNDTILITPSGHDKGSTLPDEIIELPLAGSRSGREPAPSMETGLHLSIYSKRHDVKAVIHAHPTFATSFLSAGREIQFDLTAESRAIIGIPSVVAFAVAGSKELAVSVAKAAEKSSVILLENHGVVTTGESLFQAFNRMEVLESAAKTTFISGIIGDTRHLTPEQLGLIDTLLGKTHER